MLFSFSEMLQIFFKKTQEIGVDIKTIEKNFRGGLFIIVLLLLTLKVFFIKFAIPGLFYFRLFNS